MNTENLATRFEKLQKSCQNLDNIIKQEKNEREKNEKNEKEKQEKNEKNEKNVKKDNIIKIKFQKDIRPNKKRPRENDVIFLASKKAKRERNLNKYEKTTYLQKAVFKSKSVEKIAKFSKDGCVLILSDPTLTFSKQLLTMTFSNDIMVLERNEKNLEKMKNNKMGINVLKTYDYIGLRIINNVNKFFLNLADVYSFSKLNIMGTLQEHFMRILKNIEIDQKVLIIVSVPCKENITEFTNDYNFKSMVSKCFTNEILINTDPGYFYYDKRRNKNFTRSVVIDLF